MKLLFDQNLPPHLVHALKDEFPGSAHVHPLGLGEAEDIRIWEFAKAEDFVIASKDSDFAAMSVLRGAPPKVIWIALGNCTTSEIEQTLRANLARIQEFIADFDENYLVLR